MKLIFGNTINSSAKVGLGKTQRAGFTLIELLIVAAVFTVAALLATTVFSNIQSTQRKIQGQQRTAVDGRYILETIARSVRTSTINYAVYGGPGEVTNPATILSTVDQAGIVTCFRWQANQVQLLTSTTVDCPTADPGWKSFTPGDLQVDALSFYMTPRSDPYRSGPRADGDCKSPTTLDATESFIIAGFDAQNGTCVCSTLGTDSTNCYTDQTCVTAGSVLACANPNIQPQVTIYLTTSTKNVTVGEHSSVTLQTTVASRLYQR